MTAKVGSPFSSFGPLPIKSTQELILKGQPNTSKPVKKVNFSKLKKVGVSNVKEITTIISTSLSFKNISKKYEFLLKKIETQSQTLSKSHENMENSCPNIEQATLLMNDVRIKIASLGSSTNSTKLQEVLKDSQTKLETVEKLVQHEQQTTHTFDEILKIVQETRKINLNWHQEKLKIKKIKGKPAFEVLVKILYEHPNLSLVEAIDEMGKMR